MPGLIETSDDQSTATPMCHIVTPVGMMGYGFDEVQTEATLSKLVPTGIPTAIIMDAGSTDSGPSKLALGDMSAPRTSYVRDLEKLCKLVDAFKVPLIFSSAGGDGTDEHVKVMLEILDEITAKDENAHMSFKTLSIYSGIDKEVILDRLRSGRISGCGSSVPELTEEAVNTTPHIVAQMGPEPYIAAMRENPDFNIIAGGRSYDPSPYIAYCAYMAKYPDDDTTSEAALKRWGGFTHMGKIMECGGQCAIPKSSGAYATVYRDGLFEVTPMDPSARCTAVSVAAHTLYEKSRPDHLFGPGGFLDLTTAKYEELSNERTVRVKGSNFHFSTDNGKPYQLKLEGAKVVGYRSMFMGSFRDPILISQLDVLLKRVKDYVKMQHKHLPGEYDIGFHTYGKEEVFIVGEAVASSQELAKSIAACARVGCIHGQYPGQKATSGNFAFGIAGRMEWEGGPCANFSIYHLMDLEKGEETLHFGSPNGQHVANGHTSNGHANGDAANGHGGSKPRQQQQPLLRHSVTVKGRGLEPPSPTSGEEDSAAAPPAPAGPKSSSKPATKTPKQASAATPAAAPPKTVGDLARVLRSKCAGPFEVTFDILFGSKEEYILVRDSGLLSNDVVARALGVRVDQLIWSGFFEPALAFKATIPRIRHGKLVAAGSFMENDMHGSQEYLGLMNVELPEAILEALSEHC